MNTAHKKAQGGKTLTVCDDPSRLAELQLPDRAVYFLQVTFVGH